MTSILGKSKKKPVSLSRASFLNERQLSTLAGIELEMTEVFENMHTDIPEMDWRMYQFEKELRAEVEAQLRKADKAAGYPNKMAYKATTNEDGSLNFLVKVFPANESLPLSFAVIGTEQ